MIEFPLVGNFESPSASDVDISWDSAGVLEDSAYSFGVEPYGRSLGGNGETMLYVTDGFVIGQRIYAVSDRDALSDLAQFIRVEHYGQLWLTDEHELEQFILCRFQV